MKIAASALLRQVAEYMVNQWRDLILNPDKTIDDLPPVSQFEMAKALGIAEDSRMSRLVNRYVSTPYWGILHMTKFFRAEEEKEECWREAMSHALQRIESEYPRSPVKTATLWKEVKAILEKGGVGNLKSDRMLRNRLEAKGIPSAPARKEIFKKVEKWFKEDEGHPDLERLTCSGIRKILMERHNLFSSSDSNRFRETGYTPFVEERIKKVVQILSERETRNGRDIKRKAKDIC